MDLLKKRFLFQSNVKYNAGARVCMQDLPELLRSRGYDVTLDANEPDYTKYDFIFFMSSNALVAKAKEANPRALVGIMDPKHRPARGNIEPKIADFLLVSSPEQREFFYQYNRNVVIYYMFPRMASVQKTHTPKDEIVLGYHGNKLHLENFDPNLTHALIALSKRHRLRLKAIYNVQSLKKWDTILEQHLPVEHIQWSEESVLEALQSCDIGLMPNLVHQDRAVSSLFSDLRHSIKNCRFACYHHDYVTRYKYSTNPGRLYVFAQLGIPIVSDFTPSGAHFLQDGLNGRIVHGAKGWEYGIEELIQSPSLRQTYSDHLRSYIDQHYTIEHNADRLLAFLSTLTHQTTL